MRGTYRVEIDTAGFRNDLEMAYSQRAQHWDLPSGSIAVPNTEISLQELLRPYLSEDDQATLTEDDGSRLEQILTCCGSPPRRLIAYRMLSHPLGWFSGLSQFRLNGHGYIYYDGEPETRLNNPLLASWTPDDSASLFAHGFVAAHERFLAEYMLVAESIEIVAPELLSKDLLLSGLWAGLQAHPEYWEVIERYTDRPPAGNLPIVPLNATATGYEDDPVTTDQLRRLQHYCTVAVREANHN